MQIIHLYSILLAADEIPQCEFERHDMPDEYQKLLQNQSTVKTLIRAAALIKFQGFLGGSNLSAAVNRGRLLFYISHSQI